MGTKRPPAPHKGQDQARAEGGVTYEPAGEIEAGVELQQVEAGPLASLVRGEVDTQITTARAYPRSVRRFIDTLTGLVTLDVETAASCMYALPRDGKTIEGPSARFAELAAYAWGNIRLDGRPVGEDDRHVTSRGMAWDLEANIAVAYETRRGIVTSKGTRYKEDMIGVTANAASSIAMRNAVLKLIPAALWRPLYLAARKVAVGEASTLSARRAKMLQAFQQMGVRPEQIFAKLGVAGVEDISLDHFAVLTGIFSAIHSGEATVDEAFGDAAVAESVKGGAGNGAAIEQELEALVPDTEMRASVLSAWAQAGVRPVQRLVSLREWKAKKLEPVAILAQVRGLTRGDAPGGDVAPAEGKNPEAKDHAPTVDHRAEAARAETPLTFSKPAKARTPEPTDGAWEV